MWKKQENRLKLSKERLYSGCGASIGELVICMLLLTCVVLLQFAQ